MLCVTLNSFQALIRIDDTYTRDCTAGDCGGNGKKQKIYSFAISSTVDDVVRLMVVSFSLHKDDLFPVVIV